MDLIEELGDGALRSARPAADHADRRAAALVRQLGGRSIVLVGMMGSGKTSIGRRLAARLGLDFADADAEIEAAEGMTIADIFERHGEAISATASAALSRACWARNSACWRQAAAPS